MVIIIAASIMAMLVSDYLLYFVPSYWVAFYLTRKITKLPFVDKILPNKDIVWQLTLIFFLIPLMSYSTGKINSKRILDGYNIQYAKSINLKNDNIIYEKAKIKYIGKGGNHFFFISEDNAIIYIINSEEMTQLELIKSKSKLEEPWEKLKKWFYKTNILNFNKN